MEETMDWSYPILLLTQLLIAVLLGAVATYMSVVLFDRATQGIDEWEELKRGNAAVGIVLGAMVVAVTSVLRPALKMPISGWDVGTSRLFVALGVEAVQLLVGLILAVVSILFAVWLFDMLTTRLDEWSELKRGNVAVATLLAGVIIGVSLLIGVALDGLFQLVTPLLF
jgi:uncharacterized membrane protein YjfL (UPF0719 family)